MIEKPKGAVLASIHETTCVGSACSVFDVDYHLVGYSDASHAPLRSTARRGVSGGVLSVCGFLLKSLSRHQQMVSLSSMEAALFALQGVGYRGFSCTT